MNGIPALLASKEFCVETVIVKHTSLLASVPPLSVHRVRYSRKHGSSSRDGVCYHVCPPSAVLLMFPKLLTRKNFRMGRRKER